MTELINQKFCSARMRYEAEVCRKIYVNATNGRKPCDAESTYNETTEEKKSKKNNKK